MISLSHSRIFTFQRAKLQKKIHIHKHMDIKMIFFLHFASKKTICSNHTCKFSPNKMFSCFDEMI